MLEYVIFLIIIGLVLYSVYYVYKYNRNHLLRGTTYDDDMGDYVKKLNRKYTHKRKLIDQINNVDDNHKIYDRDDVTEFRNDFFDFNNKINLMDRKIHKEIDLTKCQGMNISDVYDNLVKN